MNKAGVIVPDVPGPCLHDEAPRVMHEDFREVTLPTTTTQSTPQALLDLERSVAPTIPPQVPTAAGEVNWCEALRAQIAMINNIEEGFRKLNVEELARDDWPQAKVPEGSLPFLVEVCAGTARLTRTFINNGFHAVGIDCHRNRHDNCGPVLTLDLTEPEGSQSAWDVLQDPSLVHSHYAPPCGTASRARERPLPASEGRGHGPRPLRTEDEPWGLLGNA